MQCACWRLFSLADKQGLRMRTCLCLDWGATSCVHSLAVSPVLPGGRPIASRHLFDGGAL